MIEIKSVSMDQLTQLKQHYMEQTTAPLDGMWLNGFVPVADHYGFYYDGDLIGFCCVNDDGYLLQFFINRPFNEHATPFFEALIRPDKEAILKIKGAYPSTAEPQFLSLCLDNFTAFNVTTLLYEHKGSTYTSKTADQNVALMPIEKPTLLEVVNFSNDAIGAPKEWLKGYYSNLIARNELFGYWRKEKLTGLGECRGNDHYQKDYVDLGVIVAKSERSKGLATKILTTLSQTAYKQGLGPICSTERDNIPAQKAIAKAGFFSQNRIVQFDV